MLPHYPGGVTIYENFIYIGKSIYTDTKCMKENETYRVGVCNGNLTSIDSGTGTYFLINSWHKIDEIFYVQTGSFKDDIILVKKWKYRELKIDKILK